MAASLNCDLLVNGAYTQSRLRQFIFGGATSHILANTTVPGASPNTITMLEFRTVEDTRRAQASEQLRKVLDGLRGLGVTARVLLVERSPFTPEPIPA
ncbi:universal stress protein [Microvirga calopogonii]|uniref:universal stress protein n=1 Tax=Microvirga calopogonii TaxID=2078013 RepID=UPI000E0DA892|nr:universal stress protein [Microvirga calopogonii]